MTLLHKNGAELLRQKRHFVFRLRNGQRWVTPKTPGDSRSWRNNLSDLKRTLKV
jgi:hypothetical protein